MSCIKHSEISARLWALATTETRGRIADYVQKRYIDGYHLLRLYQSEKNGLRQSLNTNEIT